jgi:anti-anti-sigma factor
MIFGTKHLFIIKNARRTIITLPASAALCLHAEAGIPLQQTRRIAMTPSSDTATDVLEITLQHDERGAIFRLRGRLNIDSSPALRDQLLAMLQAQSPQAVIVDFGNVTYVDSSGIATLIEGLGIARMRQTTLCVQGLQGRLLHLFQIIGISTLFEKNGCGTASSVSQVS